MMLKDVFMLTYLNQGLEDHASYGTNAPKTLKCKNAGK